VTVHTDGLPHASPEEEQSLQLLLSFVPKRIDAVYTPSTAGQPPLDTLSRLDSIHYGDVFDSGVAGERVQVRLRGTYTSMPVAELDDFLVRRTLPASATDRDIEALRTAWSDLQAHEALDRDVFLTTEPSLMRYRQSVGAACEVWILSVNEALDYFETVAKGEGQYFFNSLVTTDRWTYYDERTNQLVPTLDRVWRAVTHWDDPARDNVLEYVVSLHTRLRYLMEARDRIGYLYYTSSDLGANDAVLYHLNYLFLLTTAVFDNLAWILNYLCNLGLDRKQVDLRLEAFTNRIPKSFRDLVASRESLLDVFYRTRHSVAHRVVMWGIGFRDRETGGGTNLVEIGDDLAGAIQTVDSPAPSQPYSNWGLTWVGPAPLLEPYRFATCSVREVVGLVGEFAGLVLADETVGCDVAAESEKTRNSFPKFAIPFFRAIV